VEERLMDREKIAHDLAIVYLRNRYGIDINGSIDDSSGSIGTDHLPSTTEAKYVKVGTGEKGLFGIERKQQIQAGYAIGGVFENIVKDYRCAYERFYSLLGED
jgi:hypothetical protein